MTERRDVDVNYKTRRVCWDAVDFSYDATNSLCPIRADHRFLDAPVQSMEQAKGLVSDFLFEKLDGSRFYECLNHVDAGERPCGGDWFARAQDQSTGHGRIPQPTSRQSMPVLSSLIALYMMHSVVGRLIVRLGRLDRDRRQLPQAVGRQHHGARVQVRRQPAERAHRVDTRSRPVRPCPQQTPIVLADPVPVVLADPTCSSQENGSARDQTTVVSNSDLSTHESPVAPAVSSIQTQPAVPSLRLQSSGDDSQYVLDFDQSKILMMSGNPQQVQTIAFAKHPYLDRKGVRQSINQALNEDSITIVKKSSKSDIAAGWPLQSELPKGNGSSDKFRIVGRWGNEPGALEFVVR